MSDLDNIIDVTISRETQTVSRAAFGTPAIISEFTTGKTNVTFARHRYYATLATMLADGWTVYDLEYKAAQIIFAQNPKVTQVMIGRKDSGDADWTAALAAIQLATKDWYAFTIIATKTAKVIWDADFVTGNLIDITINGVAVTQVPFNASHDQTMADIETQIEADIATSVVTIIGGAGSRTLTISIPDTTPSSIVIAVTGGGSQAGSVISYDNTGVDADLKEAAAWSETQKKIYFYASSEAGILTSGTSDIAYFMKSQNYDRTVSIYHIATNLEQVPSWIENGWPGEALPYDPGSQTWAYKTIAGVASYSLEPAERTNAVGKNCNIYTETAEVDITEEGNVASGEWIDVIRGLDWLESRLREDVFQTLVDVRKVPYTDEGVTMITGIVEAVLNEGAGKGLLNKASIVVTAPKVADIDPVDRGNRLLPDINFTASLQGAIHKTKINGVVTV
jgi:hypothetical protein